MIYQFHNYSFVKIYQQLAKNCRKFSSIEPFLFSVILSVKFDKNSQNAQICYKNRYQIYKRQNLISWKIKICKFDLFKVINFRTKIEPLRFSNLIFIIYFLRFNGSWKGKCSYTSFSLPRKLILDFFSFSF
jgi:hypothetical protein